MHDRQFIRLQQREIALLTNISALLEWDHAVCMPSSALEGRSEQIKYIQKLIHEKKISKTLSCILKKALGQDLRGIDRMSFNRLAKDIEKAKKLPSEHIKAVSVATTKGITAWQKAKEKSDFSIFKPHLEQIIRLKRQEAKYIGLPGHLYNGLLDQFEEGMTVERLKPIFNQLKYSLKQLLQQITKAHTTAFTMPDVEWPQPQQIAIVKDITARMGLNHECSRMDIFAHPFTTTIGLKDTRITNRYNLKDPTQAIFSGVHEAGHALYELGLPARYAYTVLHDSPSIGLHESQSRFWENMIARDLSFWKNTLPLLKKYFPEKAKGLKSRDLYRYVNTVSPSLIRVEADEVTYCLHIILRFELELRLIEGTLEVSDLPQYWNEAMHDMLGITPGNDAEGVLQDVHWSMGMIGYFPTYAIGSIYASMLFETMIKRQPSITEDINKGDYSSVLVWLRKNVHNFGRSRTSEEIIRKVCGTGLDHNFFITNLKKKYFGMYRLS